jgi:hypothetical protein
LTTRSFPHDNFSSVYWIFTKLDHMIPLWKVWSSLVKIQYTELKLSCGNDPVVKNYIYSNSDLDLWLNDPKIKRVLPLPQGNHVAMLNLATWFPCGRGRTLLILGSLPLYRLIIYIDGHILWCTHFLFLVCSNIKDGCHWYIFIMF